MKLIHVTAAANIESILSNGLAGPSYWAGDYDLAAYYAETVRDEGDVPVYLEVDVADLDEKLLEPDHPSVSEPIMSHVRGLHGWSRSEGEERVLEEWDRVAGTWRDSLDLVGSVRYRGVVPAEKLSFNPPCQGHRA